ncbi:MAG: putative zinc-binding peptidase [Opitutales bacterium]|nr:putative zinc-binding peptidase [Opitutales bacterium]
MKTFDCDNCGERIFFENTSCLACGSMVGFVPEHLTLSAFRPDAGGYSGIVGDASGSLWKKCRNYTEANVCNWMLPADSAEEYCLSCRLNEVIPDLSVGNKRTLWAKMEAAKRRLMFSLLRLRLPILNKEDDPDRGLAYRFLADPGDDFARTRRVLTGHDAGVITINIAEADDAVREKMRLDMREVYRTLLGHFRHESGHYYWDRLFADTGREEAFRAVFGDEREDYAGALKRHYRNGPPPDWQERHITSYAAAHPWEDWAETWAHYLHITDTLDTACCNGIEIRTPEGKHIVRDPLRERFSSVAQDWFALRFVLNSLNRSMGLQDPYPFVMGSAVIEKLTYIHDWLRYRHDTGHEQ